MALTRGAKIIIAIIVTRPARSRSSDMPERWSDSNASREPASRLSRVRSRRAAISLRSTTMLQPLMLAVSSAARSDAGKAPGIPVGWLAKSEPPTTPAEPHSG